MSSEPAVQAPPRPLHIVGVSLGSATRDHRVRLTLLGREVLAERVGVPDLMASRRKLLELDGRVDAIGIGGANLALGAGGRIYPIRDIVRLVRGIRTPIVDGSGAGRGRARIRGAGGAGGGCRCPPAPGVAPLPPGAPAPPSWGGGAKSPS